MFTEMESDLSTALAVSIIQNKPSGMDVVDYVTSIQSKIMEKENELFFQEFLCDSDLIQQPIDQQTINNQQAVNDQQSMSNQQYMSDEIIFNHQQNIQENLSTLCVDTKSFEKFYNSIFSPDKTIEPEYEMLSVTPNFAKESNECLVQPVITMKTLNEMTKIPVDSGYNTNDRRINSQDINQKRIETMSMSIQKALDLLTYTLFDNSKLLEAVINWHDGNNLVRYFADLVANMAKKNEFGFTCRDHVMKFVQNTSFKILDEHHLYNSIHVEYQCNLLAKFCFDKYIRWDTISLLIQRLKIDVQVVPSSSSLRSIFYTFHLIDKLMCDVDFHVSTSKNMHGNSLTGLWKLNRTNKSGNETEIMEQKLKEWKSLLECISMESLKKNVCLVSIRANQCLESLKLITSKK